MKLQGNLDVNDNLDLICILKTGFLKNNSGILKNNYGHVTITWRLFWWEKGVYWIAFPTPKSFHADTFPSFFYFFFNFILFLKLYIIVLVLPNIKMNPPQVYMRSPSWTLLPPPSPYYPNMFKVFFFYTHLWKIKNSPCCPVWGRDPVSFFLLQIFLF